MDALTQISTLHYLVLGAALFLLGVIGVLTRRNVVIVLMSIELILNAVNLNLVAFSHMWGNLHGQVFSIFIITDAAAEAAVGLGILIAFFRNKETVNVDEVNLLKW
jgi:NADH-quinone oxidoreductase subunit K